MGDFEMWGWISEGLDIWGAPREKTDKISEEDRKRVQEDSKKAKQVWQQIKKDKKTNNDMANFLAYLLKKIDNDDIVSWIYDVFFKVKNPKTKMTYLRKNPNTIVIIWIFAPFYKKEIKKFNLLEFFEKIEWFGSSLDLKNYMEYLKKLSSNYHDNIPINKESFLDFLCNVVLAYWLINNESKNNDPSEIKKNIENILY